MAMITRSMIVKADVDKIYTYWSNFENFPTFMENIKSVRKTGDRSSHWEMEGPLGTTVKWDAETTVMENNKRIAWSTKDNEGDVTTSGQVTFNPLPNNQTEITVMLHYEPNKGLAGDVVEKLFSNPEKQLEKDLANFKNYIEGRHERSNL
ncbi:MAG: SRPBCC family protein [Chloroflexota bacterium]|nr:MAG: SRPBCC family protein [Chloroflexota bacterium]